MDGWTIRALTDIKKGQFVSDYIGKVCFLFLSLCVSIFFIIFFQVITGEESEETSCSYQFTIGLDEKLVIDSIDYGYLFILYFVILSIFILETNRGSFHIRVIQIWSVWSYTRKDLLVFITKSSLSPPRTSKLVCLLLLLFTSFCLAVSLLLLLFILQTIVSRRRTNF